MQVDYVVHNVSPHRTPVQGDVAGKPMTVWVDSLEVELSPVSGAHSSIQLRFIGEDVAQAKAEFERGQIKTLTFSVKE